LTKKKLFVWTCDYSENSGEGKLARLFIDELKKKKFIIILNQQNTLNQKYISTLWGIFYCWKKYLNQETVCYLNYLPLWNFLIFVLLPPKTVFGPITGGAYYSKSFKLNYFIREYIFPIFYKVSEFLINLRGINPIFSTDLLKKYLSKKTIIKSKFNFVVKNFSFKKKIKRKKIIDFLIYYRNHNNKKLLFPFNLIRKLIKYNFKIYIVGDRLNLPKIKNCGKLSKNKISILQSKAKFTIISGENPYSFFILECIAHHMKIIIDKKMKKKITMLKKNFIELNFNSLNKIIKQR